MSYTAPNQRTVQIHREPAKTNFLGIKNENWMAASRDLGAHALQLYLYFAANADNFKFALSPVAVRQATGMARSTYNDQFHKLVDKGYLTRREGNLYDFYEVPQAVTQFQSKCPGRLTGSTGKEPPSTGFVETRTPQDREININTINNKYCWHEKQASHAVSPNSYDF